MLSGGLPEQIRSEVSGLGYVHIYTGNGKGKTTAALGLALRAVCAGSRVYIGQFIKGMDYSELRAAELLPNLKIEQYGRGCFIRGAPSQEDIELAKSGLKRASSVLRSGDFDVVILDEVNVAVHFGLLTPAEVIEVVSERADHVEVVLTGRYAPPEFVAFADLVTEMVEVKHYYTLGVQARRGIEF